MAEPPSMNLILGVAACQGVQEDETTMYSSGSPPLQGSGLLLACSTAFLMSAVCRLEAGSEWQTREGEAAHWGHRHQHAGH